MYYLQIYNLFTNKQIFYNMLNTWLDKDHTIDLPNLFAHFGYERTIEEKNHIVFRRNNRYRIIFYTDNGFLYYHVESPQKKLSASSLIIEEVSRIEGKKNKSLWDKVNDYYNKVLNSKDLKLNDSEYNNLVKVPLDFNHFLSYKFPLKTHQSGLYSNITKSNCFQDRIFESVTGETLFPLLNIQNEISGYFIDGKGRVEKFEESDTKESLWYSNIPKVIKWLVIFNNPKEAIAFHEKFGLENAVYLALGEINYETTKILYQIHQLTKVKKIVLSFTGQKKIEGYLRDLHFMSFKDDSNFFLKLNDDDVKIRFHIGEKKSFSRFYKSIQTFNQGLAKNFLKYNKVMDQHLINKHSFIISKENDNINVRVPLEVNAIKYFVWSYYKNYLNKSIEILKPKQNNWCLEWEVSQSLTLKGKEEQVEDYKIAL